MSARDADHPHPKTRSTAQNKGEITPPAESGFDTVLHAAMQLFAEHGYQATSMKNIAEKLDIQAPSLYHYVSSKQEVLQHIMFRSMETLLAKQRSSLDPAHDVRDALRHATQAHALFHAHHRAEAFIGNREIRSLDPPARARLVAMRDTYEEGFRSIVERGYREGIFEVKTIQITTYAILEMGIGISSWFSPDGPLSADEVAEVYADLALRLVGSASPEGDRHSLAGQ